MKTGRATVKEISGIPPGHTPFAVVEQVQGAWFSLKGAAAYTGLSVRTLREWLSHPERPLPCYRVGGKILLRRAEVDAWLAGFRQVGAQDLNALADAMLRELQHESNTESGGHGLQRRATKGRIKQRPRLGAGRVQNGGLKGPLLATGEPPHGRG